MHQFRAFQYNCTQTQSHKTNDANDLHNERPYLLENIGYRKIYVEIFIFH